VACILRFYLDYMAEPRRTGALMSRWRKYMPFRWIRRVSRVAAALSVLPALVLSPLAAQALVIHDHHGHDTHGHTVTLCDLDDLQESSEHQHEEHDHDGLPVDPAEDEGTPILIVLDLPEMLPGARTSSAGAAVATGIGVALRTIAINSCVVEDGRAPVESQQTLANIPRAYGMVTSILLTNHALLL